MRKPTRKNTQFSNFKTKCIPPEHCAINVFYACTLNPEIQPIRKGYKETIGAFFDWYSKIENVLLKCNNCQFYLNTEISSNGRLHYHGYILILNIPKFYYYDLLMLKDNFSFEIDTIENHITWRTYMDKQKDFMLLFCTNHGISYNIDTIGDPNRMDALVNNDIVIKDNFKITFNNKEFADNDSDIISDESDYSE